MVKIKITVRGMVQGVGYRYYCYKQAIVLDIKGYVRNLNNGDVEIEAEGNANEINEFIKQAELGPKFSKVNSVSLVKSPYEGKYSKFSIL
ncbi:MAG: acylphosphatase [Ignavibacteria bacterium]|nr:acylphosphatase [Ignavibacteria bacterium]